MSVENLKVYFHLREIQILNFYPFASKLTGSKNININIVIDLKRHPIIRLVGNVYVYRTDASKNLNIDSQSCHIVIWSVYFIFVYNIFEQ